MKKLMLVAAAAAMTSAFATTQVYEMRINLKTTECKDANLGPNQNPFIAVAPGNTVPISYRAVSTITIAGLIWACDCEYVMDLGQIKGAGVGEFRWYTFARQNAYAPAAPLAAEKGREGYIFWNTRTGAPWGYSAITKPAATADNVDSWTIPGYTATVPGPEAFAAGGAGNPMPTMRWLILQRIGMRAEQVEGTWEISDTYSGFTEYDLLGAGFGTARTGTVVGATECGEAIITSMTGNVAGYIAPTDTNGGCVFCGVVACNPFPFCNCTAGASPLMGVTTTSTAAYGTWTLKYNQALSRRLLAAETIRDCYRFSAAVDDMVRFLEARAR